MILKGHVKIKSMEGTVLYEVMGKTTKRYLQGFDKIFTVNYDSNIEKLAGREVYHLLGCVGCGHVL